MSIKITYQLADGQTIEIEVSPEVATVLTETYRKELALQKQDKRHIARLGFTEGITESHASLMAEDVADLVERMEDYAQLHSAVDRLPEIQRHRIQLHFFEGLSVGEIADIEGACHQSVSESLQTAIENLQKTLL